MKTALTIGGPIHIVERPVLHSVRHGPTPVSRERNRIRCRSRTIASFDPSGEITQFLSPVVMVKSSWPAPCSGSKETKVQTVPDVFAEDAQFRRRSRTPIIVELPFSCRTRCGALRQGVYSSGTEGLRRRPVWMRSNRVPATRPGSAAGERQLGASTRASGVVSSIPCLKSFHVPFRFDMNRTALLSDVHAVA